MLPFTDSMKEFQRKSMEFLAIMCYTALVFKGITDRVISL